MKLKNPNLLRHHAYINGQFVNALDAKTFPIYNPYNGEKIAEVADCGVEDTKIAIEKAAVAFQSWRQLTGTERGQILRRWYELQLENLDDLATILTIEQGKPLTESKGEIRYGASFVEWFAEEARRVYGDTIPGHQRDKRIMTIKQPIGVVAAITPWNFPNAKSCPCLSRWLLGSDKACGINPFISHCSSCIGRRGRYSSWRFQYCYDTISKRSGTRINR